MEKERLVMFRKLDVGCGHDPKGDINVDLFLNKSERYDDTSLNVKTIPNFIRAGACHLPFKDKCFVIVICFHVLEHVDNP